MDDENKATSTDSALPDRSDLSKIYPKAKTYEERKADKKAFEERRLARLPKHVPFWVAIRLSVILSLSLLLLHYRLGWAAFALVGAACFGVIFYQLKKIFDSFNKLNQNAQLFTVSYILCFGPIGSIYISRGFNHSLPLAISLILIGAFLAWMLAAVLLSKSIPDAKKILTIIMTVAVAIAAQIISFIF